MVWAGPQGHRPILCVLWHRAPCNKESGRRLHLRRSHFSSLHRASQGVETAIPKPNPPYSISHCLLCIACFIFPFPFIIWLYSGLCFVRERRRSDPGGGWFKMQLPCQNSFFCGPYVSSKKLFYQARHHFIPYSKYIQYLLSAPATKLFCRNSCLFN